MENSSKRARLASEEVSEHTDAIVSIDDLPHEIMISIFRHLKIEEICQIGLVCKKWYEISRVPILWNRVDVRISRWHNQEREFLQLLPPSLSRLKISFGEEIVAGWMGLNHFQKRMRREIFDFLVKLGERCPNIQALIFQNAEATVPITLILNLLKLLPATIRIFVMHSSDISGKPPEKYGESELSNIEVLDFSYTRWYVETKEKFSGDFSNFVKPKQMDMSPSQFLLSKEEMQSLFLKMPLLRHLRLAGVDRNVGFFECVHCVMSQLEILDLENTKTCPDLFQNICDYGINLTELYVCRTLLMDKDFKFKEHVSFLPRLKTICLCLCYVKYTTIIALIKSCPSLQHIYVSAIRKDPEYDYAQCNSEKVHIVENNTTYCNHFTKVDYMRM